MLLQALQDHLDCMAQLKTMTAPITRVGDMLAALLLAGRKILVCGNGGSASDAQHFAAELVGRFEHTRDAWPAIALTANTSILTAIANDYDFHDVFARQVQGLGRAGDALVAISTSGDSENVLRAVQTAKERGLRTIGLSGRAGGKLKPMVEMPIVIAGNNTARIQETHIFILHCWASIIENKIISESYPIMK